MGDKDLEYEVLKHTQEVTGKCRDCEHFVLCADDFGYCKYYEEPTHADSEMDCVNQV